MTEWRCIGKDGERCVFALKYYRDVRLARAELEVLRVKYPEDDYRLETRECGPWKEVQS